MASAKNKVISGDYQNKDIIKTPFENSLIICGDNITINKTTVEEYELVTEDQMKSGTSAVLRAGAGALLLGPIGLLAGLSARNKGIYLVAIIFKNGKKSLIEINDKLYKALVTGMF